MMELELHCNEDISLLFVHVLACPHVHFPVIHVVITCMSFIGTPLPTLPPPTNVTVNPCVPSPCGPNSQCKANDQTPICSCLTNYIGRPPTCRPECTINAECAGHLACIGEQCKDPCPGSCGRSAYCQVVNHSPQCTCDEGFTGDPFAGCTEIPPSKGASIVQFFFSLIARGISTQVSFSLVETFSRRLAKIDHKS